MEFLNNFNDIKTIDPKELGIRKKLEIFSAKDENTLNNCIIHISQKTRVLQKDVEKINEIYEKVKEFTKENFDKKLLIIDAPLCSKAKKRFEEEGFTVT